MIVVARPAGAYGPSFCSHFFPTSFQGRIQTYHFIGIGNSPNVWALSFCRGIFGQGFLSFCKSHGQWPKPVKPKKCPFMSLVFKQTFGTPVSIGWPWLAERLQNDGFPLRFPFPLTFTIAFPDPIVRKNQKRFEGNKRMLPIGLLTEKMKKSKKTKKKRPLRSFRSAVFTGVWTEFGTPVSIEWPWVAECLQNDGFPFFSFPLLFCGYFSLTRSHKAEKPIHP